MDGLFCEKLTPEQIVNMGIKFCKTVVLAECAHKTLYFQAYLNGIQFCVVYGKGNEKWAKELYSFHEAVQFYNTLED